MPDSAAWSAPAEPPVRERYWIHIALFLLTLVSTIWSGGTMTGRFDHYAEMGRWVSLLGVRLNVDFMLDGLRFGGSLLLFLTVHEFGHYFAARRHRVSTTLPYYIPFPFNGIGTFGAVIRIREQVPSLRKLFDIGVAGPIAGFVVAVGLLIYGVVTLPGPEYVQGFPAHEALKEYVSRFGELPDRMLAPPPEGTMSLVVGQTPLYWFITQFAEHAPPMHEMYHYPYLFAGWLGLFFTALNLLPVGQLDGGHMLFAGPKWHGRLARAFVLLLLASGCIGYVDGATEFREASLIKEILSWSGLAVILVVYLRRIMGDDLGAIVPYVIGMVVLSAVALGVGEPLLKFGYSGWLVWVAIIVFLIRVDHPPVLVNEPLTRGRRLLAWAGLVIFVLCFSLKPLYIL